MWIPMPEQASLPLRTVRAIGQGVLAFIRPWPLQPIVAAPMVLFLGMWSAVVVVTAAGAGQPTPPVWRAVLSIVLPAGIIAITFAVGRRFVGEHQLCR